MKEWKDLYQTIYHCLLLGELCSTRPAIIYLFQEVSQNYVLGKCLVLVLCLANYNFILVITLYILFQISKICKSDTLRELSHEMMRVINFEESIQRNRFVAKAGIDPELDKS